MLFFLDPSDQLTATTPPPPRYTPNIGAPPPARPCLRRVYKRSLTIPDPDSYPESEGTDSASDTSSPSLSRFGGSSSSAEPHGNLKKTASKMIKVKGKSRKGVKGKPEIASSPLSSSSSSSSSSDSSTPLVVLERPASTTISRATLQSEASGEIFHVGIIDYLQKYNRMKKLARFAKSITHDKDKLSTASPSFYSRRFREFVANCVE